MEFLVDCRFFSMITTVFIPSVMTRTCLRESLDLSTARAAVWRELPKGVPPRVLPIARREFAPGRRIYVSIDVFGAEHGEVTARSRLRRRVPVDEYLKLQRRFAHLFGPRGDPHTVAAIQAIADRNIERFGLA